MDTLAGGVLSFYHDGEHIRDRDNWKARNTRLPYHQSLLVFLERLQIR